MKWSNTTEFKITGPVQNIFEYTVKKNKKRKINQYFGAKLVSAMWFHKESVLLLRLDSAPKSDIYGDKQVVLAK